ncbi:MAG: nicotinate-nucleotide adenylyltransferase [Thermomicrobiales bacterium]
MSNPRHGIFGGTFDPIHIGHLAVAERACDELGLESIIFVPALTPPHKPYRRVSPIDERVQMLELGIANNERFSWSDADMRPGEPSYTVSLLGRLHAAHPNAELHFIIGEDSLRDFGTWHRPREILQLTQLAVAGRPGVKIDERLYTQLPELRERVIRFDAPLLEVSSTALRRRVSEGKSIRYLVPDAVNQYVLETGLYREPDVIFDNTEAIAPGA